jgi:hypothetical protein
MSTESERRDVDPTTAAQSDPHGSGTMGPHPTQAMFLGGLAVALLILMIAATTFVMLSALTYG